MGEHALLAITALLLNAALAGPRQWFLALGISHITRLPFETLRLLERKLNRDRRTADERQMRGLILVVALVSVAVAAGLFLSFVIVPAFSAVELLVLACCLPVRQGWDIARQVQKHIAAGNLAQAKAALIGTNWRHHMLLEDSGLCRAAIETLAVNFSEKIVGPVFWYMLAGLPGLLVSKIAFLLQETFAQTQQDERSFGKAAISFHQMLHYFPSRLAAFLWLVAGRFLPNGRWREALQMIQREMGGYPDRLAVASAASVLRLTLGGPGSIHTSGAWVGHETVRAGAGDVKRALFAYLILHLLLFILLWLFT